MKQKIPFTLLLLTLALGTAAAQDFFSDLERGIALTTKAESAYALDFSNRGYGVSIAHYWLKPIHPKLMLSLDTRLSLTYAQDRQEGWVYTEEPPLFVNSNVFVDAETGNLDYFTAAIALPLKLRYQPWQSVPLYLQLCYEPYFHVFSAADWSYDKIWFKYRDNTRIVVDRGQERSFHRRLFGAFLSAGIGYRGERGMLEASFGGGNLDFDDTFVKSIETQFLELSYFWRLQRGH